MAEGILNPKSKGLATEVEEFMLNVLTGDFPKSTMNLLRGPEITTQMALEGFCWSWVTTNDVTNWAEVLSPNHKVSTTSKQKQWKAWEFSEC